MRILSSLFMTIILFAACSKNKGMEIPEMIYTDFNNRKIAFGGHAVADLDKSGNNDILFFTMPVGDPLLNRDYHRYHVQGAIHNFFPVKDEEAPVLAKGMTISKNSFAGYEWYNATSLLLAQKVITMQSTYWEGAWHKQSHKYLPLRLLREQHEYYGWIEISFDTTSEKIILHKTGISKEPNREVIAGL